MSKEASLLVPILDCTLLVYASSIFKSTDILAKRKGHCLPSSQSN
jgi:hypothetical protein